MRSGFFFLHIFVQRAILPVDSESPIKRLGQNSTPSPSSSSRDTVLIKSSKVEAPSAANHSHHGGRRLWTGWSQITAKTSFGPVKSFKQPAVILQCLWHFWHVKKQNNHMQADLICAGFKFNWISDLKAETWTRWHSNPARATLSAQVKKKAPDFPTNRTYTWVPSERHASFCNTGFTLV